MKSSCCAKSGAGFILIILTLACGQSGAISTAHPPSEAEIRQTLDVVIAGTAHAAQTQTASSIPPTITPSLTSTITPTPTTTFTPTPTFFFSLFTATIESPPTVAPQGTPSNIIQVDGYFALTPIREENRGDANQWRCIVRYSPNLTVAPNTKFYAMWTVVNTGWNDWTTNTIDFRYSGGLRGIHKNIMDTPSTVSYGGVLNIGETFIAPHRPGEYGSSYVLRVDASSTEIICRMRLTLHVK
jgi:hypothetical protein